MTKNKFLSNPVNLLTIISLITILCTSSLIRHRFLDMPFERDEGEYAYAGQLILDGKLPYDQMYSMKLPGVYASYAFIMALMDETRQSIHFALIFINTFTIILLFLLGHHLSSPVGGLLAATTFSILSLGASVHGIIANAEHFVILFSMAGLYILLKSMEYKSNLYLFISGIALGTGMLMKQHGIMFAILGIIWFGIKAKHNENILKLSFYRWGIYLLVGIILPYIFTGLMYTGSGLFKPFWFWTVQYALAYSSQVPLEYAWSGFLNQGVPIVQTAPIFWILSAIGLVFCIWTVKTKKNSILIITLVFLSFVSICPGFYFRPHYFILLLPAASICAGIGINSLIEKFYSEKSSSFKIFLMIIVAFFCSSLTLYQQKEFLFEKTPEQACRHLYSINPFPESIKIARYIKANTQENDKIAVIGSEPQIYFYADRPAATGFIYMYPLMEDHEFALQMQKQMINEIEANRPKYMIYFRHQLSWLPRPGSHDLIFKWFEGYKNKNYDLVGMVDIGAEKTEYSWMPDVKWPPSSPYWAAILKRKADL